MVVVKKKLEICVNAGEFAFLYKSIFKVGLAPFGLALTPNISLVIINRFSAAIMELVSVGYGAAFIFETHLMHHTFSKPIDCYSNSNADLSGRTFANASFNSFLTF